MALPDLTGLIPIALPDLGAGPFPVRVSSWLVESGDEVEQGDCVVEMLVSGMTCDLASPAAGRIGPIVKEVDAIVAIGEILAWIEPVAAPGAQIET